jgi:hypothetical protein
MYAPQVTKWEAQHPNGIEEDAGAAANGAAANGGERAGGGGGGALARGSVAGAVGQILVLLAVRESGRWSSLYTYIYIYICMYIYVCI